MALTYRIDAETGVIYSRFEGEITLEGIQEHTRRLHADPAFRPGLVQIAEVASIRPHVDFNEMYGFVRWVATLVPIDKTAIVAPENNAFGMARMYAQLSEGSPGKVEAFRDMASARHWLGLPE